MKWSRLIDGMKCRLLDLLLREPGYGFVGV